LSKAAFAFVLIFGVLAMLGTLELAAGENASFTLQPLDDRTITLSLKGTDSVSGSFSVVSNDEIGINFFVTDPNNFTILQYDNTLHKSFSFTADMDGDYQLHFDNSLSAGYSKTVSLDYSITRYIMGMPQEQFLFLLVAAVALVGILLYAFLIPK
jgi:hypothetical protein